MSASFDFEQYRVGSADQSEQSEQSEQTFLTVPPEGTEEPVETPEPAESTGFDLERFRISPDVEKEPSVGLTVASEIGQFLKRVPARAAEVTLGAAGDLQSVVNFGQDLVSDFVEDITGESAIVRGLIKGPREFGLPNLPGAADVRAAHETVTGELFKAQTEGQELADKVVSDVVSFMLPTGGKQSLVRSVITSISSNIGSEIVKKTTGSEEGAAATKVGLSVLSSFINRGGTKKFVDGLWKKSNDLQPSNAKVPTKGLNKAAEALQRELKKGGTAPSKNESLTKLKEIVAATKKGLTSLDELTEFKKSINEIRGKAGLFAKTGQATKQEAARTARNLNKVADLVEKQITDFGKTNAPDWLTAWKQANQGTAGLKASSAISRFISNKADLRNMSPETMTMFGILGGVGAAETAIGGTALAATAELLQRVTRSPVLRGFYLDVLKGASQENVAMVSRNLKALQKELDKEEASSR